MTVRVFDGTDDEIRFSNNPNLTGAFTLAMLVKRGVDTAYHAVLSTHSSTGVGTVTVEISSQSLGASTPLLDIAGVGSSAPTVAVTVTAADGWVLLVVTKGAGSVAPRFHKFTGTWVRDNGANALGNPASHSGGTTRLGEYQDIDDLNGKIALAAIWAGTALSDAQVDALATGLNVSAWTGHAVPPTRVWRPGDTTPTDLMGAADTATINGTTVDTLDDPPGWTLGGGVAPVNTVAPAVTGTLTTGQTLSTTNGTWTGDATITFTYQWQRAGVNIGGATASTHVLVEADEANAIRCVVTGTNAAGVASANSNAVTPLDEPVNSVAPAVTGTAHTGQTLTCSTGTWSNTPTGYTYQWKRAGVDISGATASTYLLVVADEGLAIKCTVIASNANGPGTATDSNTVTPTAAPDIFVRVTGAWVAVDQKARVAGAWV